MVFIDKLIGILIIVVSVIFITKPQGLKRVVEFVKIGKRVYLCAVVRAIVAALILVSVPKCEFPIPMLIVGALFAVSAALTFILPIEKVYGFIRWVESQSFKSLRALACVPLAIGLIVVFSA